MLELEMRLKEFGEQFWASLTSRFPESTSKSEDGAEIDRLLDTRVKRRRR